MSGISSKAAGTLQNKEKTFQGQRFDDDLGLNWVQFKWRNHDPQIGRFIEIDPLSEKYVYNSTYAFSENKVTGDIELEGLESVSINGLSHASSQNHHQNKDLSTIKLNLDVVLKSNSTTQFNENNSATNGRALISALQQARDPSSVTENDVNVIYSVSETTSSYSAKIIDNQNGKFLAVTNSATTTQVNLNMGEVSSVTKTTSTSTSYTPVTNIDNKNNEITISTIPGGNATTKNTENIKLNSASQQLQSNTKEAIKTNKNAMSQGDKIIRRAVENPFQ